MSDQTAKKKAIKDLIIQINQAWGKGNPQELHRYFHADMVIVSPEMKKLGIGRDACVQSYAKFVSIGKVHGYNERDFIIDVWEDTAAAVYKYEIDFEIKGQRFSEIGRDMFVFSHSDNKWLAVWRMILPEPAAE